MKWEYLVIYSDFSIPNSKLNKLGKEGWELVTITLNLKTNYTRAYLKRPLE